MVAALVTGASLVWSWFLIGWLEGKFEGVLNFGFAGLTVFERASTELLSNDAEGRELARSEESFEPQESRTEASRLAGVDQGDLGDSGSEGSEEDFTESEWLEAQRKLEEAERRTGLTFVQRARLRRQIALGETVEVPNFLQRRGPIPPWFSGLDPGEAEVEGAEVVSSSSERVFLEALQVHAERFCQYLGMQVAVWSALRRVSRRFSQSVVIAVVEQWANTGAEGLSPSGHDFQGEFWFDGSCWVPVSLGIRQRSSGSGPSRAPAGLDQDRVPSDFDCQVGGSPRGTRPAGLDQDRVPSDFDCQVGGSPRNAGSGTVGSSDRARPNVQVGGSAGSQDPFPVHLTVQEGGSSGSHGMAVARNQELCYEDYCGADLLVDEFPYVGSWLRTHFLVQLFSQTGGPVLWTLGERAPEWLILRCTSAGVRYAVAFAVVDVLREGVYAALYQGPQWLSAAEDFIVSGHPQGGNAVPQEPVDPLSMQPDGVVFPYAEGPPGMVAHYLWRVFMLIGWSVLDFLGDRVSSWRCLRATAQGFRSSTTLAVTIWLRRTYHLYVASAQATYAAAETYIQGGAVEYPFEDRGDDGNLDDLPLRPPAPEPPGEQVQGIGFRGLWEESSSSSSSGRSTTEPSVDPLGSSGSEVEEPDYLPAPAGAPVEAQGSGASAVRYEARVGAFLVCCGDDTFTVPLEGWFQEAIEGLVQSLNTGDWTRLQEGVEAGGFGSICPEVSGGHRESGDSQGPGGSVVPDWSRVLGRILLLWWILIQSAGASREVVPWNPQEVSMCEALEVLDVGSPDEGGDSRGGCDGSSLWTVIVGCLTIGSWELMRLVFRHFKGNGRAQRAVGSQTEGEYVPLPLGLGVPHRDRILFCLWRAGYPVDVQEYEEEIQAGFHWLVGDYLVRLENAEPSESD